MIIILNITNIPLLLIIPYLSKLAIDKAFINRDLRLFFILAAIGGGVFILRTLITSFNNYFLRRINQGVYFDIAGDLFRHLQHLQLSFFDNRSTGEYIYRIDADVKDASGFICNTIPQIVKLFPRFLFIFVIVFYLNWKIALFSVLLLPLMYISTYLFGKWQKEIMRERILKTQRIFIILQEVFSHIHLIKALGKERYEIDKFEEKLAKRKYFELKNEKLSRTENLLNSVLNKAIIGIIGLYGGYQVVKGAMTLGSLAAIMIYLTQLIELLRSISIFCQSIMVNSLFRQRLEEILDLKPSICDAQDAIAYNIKNGKIEFRGVFFGYKKDSLVLKGINFSIEPAAKAALVGLSGCGKTTILSLILRLYEQEKGAIFIDGIDIRKIKLDSLKSHIGIALQEPFLWNDTIANNILYDREEATFEEAIKAAKLAEAHDFIMNFPDKYDSLIGEMACKISEGQKQRIAIARALIKKPKILILDEAMSSIDPKTEDKIIENILSEFMDSTIIIVSHRLSAARKMGLVYFLESPDRLDIGAHEELMVRNFHYAGLFMHQIEKIK